MTYWDITTCSIFYVLINIEKKNKKLNYFYGERTKVIPPPSSGLVVLCVYPMLQRSLDFEKESKTSYIMWKTAAITNVAVWFQKPRVWEIKHVKTVVA